MDKLYIIKIGGNIIDDDSKLSGFLDKFSAIKEQKILVHGGGKLATRVAEAMNVPQQMLDGRRITDAETLKVVTMVYAGYINKNIVASLQKRGCNALGLTGADGNIITAHKRIHPITDYGFVGDVDAVNAGFIDLLLHQGISLVMAPLTHDAGGSLLNTNADTIAQEIAKGLSHLYEVSLIYCFEKNGVLQNASDDSSVIPTITLSSFMQMKKEGSISDGMIPKLQNAFAALDAGVSAVSIGHADQLPALISKESGTLIQHD
ncbi:MAG: acetylglutamate kinase [Chitinophagaceae bacterium]|nr:MAG: acetylglutamate kinase [Chitinophagaceae bacterium]